MPGNPPPSHPVLSVVVPMYNEEDVLPLFVERLRPVLDDMTVGYEVIVVDDGSTDNTPVLLQRALRDWPGLRIVRLRANSGHQAAISAGLQRSLGDWVVTIDADLQDPPETIARMYGAAVAQNVDVVYGVRTDRTTDSAFKRHTAGAFYRLMRRLAKLDISQDAGDFRMMSRSTVDAIVALPEHNRVLRLVVPTLGFPSTTVEYRRDARAAGESKYPLSKMIRLTLDSITGFSQAPLRFATWFSLFGFVVAALVLVYVVWSKLNGGTTSGWASTVVILAVFSGLQLLCLGILGEYVGRTYTALQQRPSYYVAYDSDHTGPLGSAETDEPVD
ncbi:glucosyl transferase [Flexivirga endophytica]|uniref:Glucosyl transferase n=1 Tax=Flexivirga endophytica TaxID=1849103 RepID=A0A916T2P4_9MICO|nr:glucosyl transferase [Flexivirga endophytica]GHB61521.1 glucosyl transferase [Flexivirga endophytica]